MVCPKCGTVVGDSYRECPICGWELVEGEPEYVDADAQLVDDEEEQNDALRRPGYKRKAVGILAAAAVFIICALSLIPSFMHIGYKSVVSDYYKSIKTNDYALMLSLYPAQVSQIGGVSKDKFVKNTVDNAAQNYTAAYSKDYKYSYKITEVKKSAAPAELANVSEAAQLSVALTLTGNGKKDRIQTTINVIKQNGKWYIRELSE